jgi:hypothetical protein
MIIGTDYYWDIAQNKIIRGKGSTAVQSRLGYLLSRPMSNSTGYTTSASMLNILIQHKNEEYDLERFWKLESMGVTTDLFHGLFCSERCPNNNLCQLSLKFRIYLHCKRGELVLIFVGRNIYCQLSSIWRC